MVSAFLLKWPLRDEKHFELWNKNDLNFLSLKYNQTSDSISSNTNNNTTPTTVTQQQSKKQQQNNHHNNSSSNNSNINNNKKLYEQLPLVIQTKERSFKMTPLCNSKWAFHQKINWSQNSKPLKTRSPKQKKFKTNKDIFFLEKN